MNSFTVSRLAAAAWLALLGNTALAAEPDPRECSMATLSGAYLFSASGWSATTGVWQPKAIIEYIRFNADGTLVVLSATVANPIGNGAIVQVPPGGGGSYVLDAGCTGSLVFANGPSFSIVAAPKGDELWMVQTNFNNVLQGSVKRLAR